MVNKPKYYKAWQAMTQAYELILDSDYVNKFYAYNALNFYFNDEEDVKSFVLTNLYADDKTKVYSDPEYGLSTITGLTRWSAAAVSTTKTALYNEAKALQTYWAS